MCETQPLMVRKQKLLSQGPFLRVAGLQEKAVACGEPAARLPSSPQNLPRTLKPNANPDAARLRMTTQKCSGSRLSCHPSPACGRP